VARSNKECRFIASGGRHTLLTRAKALAVLLCAASAPLPAASVPSAISTQSVIRATPALWEIRDADTTIYLFGTFHQLDGRTVWFDDKVRKAFDDSGELVLETVVPDDISGFRATVSEAPAQPGTEGKLKPFIAQTRAAVGHGRTLGMSVELGADAVLRRVAVDTGKPVGGLERFEEQLGTLANIPAPSATPGFRAVQPASVSITDLLKAWQDGDTGAFSTMLVGFEAKAPVAYRMLIADRNAKWGQWIANRLDQPGIVFVAVGSGHLAGKDSVQQWLAARGIASNRIS
jgi:uncharacterized protein YbaP (TraB family)